MGRPFTCKEVRPAMVAWWKVQLGRKNNGDVVIIVGCDKSVDGVVRRRGRETKNQKRACMK
ncbi:50S ribosomal protein L21 [Sesbania bispinosa]|nr:50S ribosomal protein L21 [Sesbania bispinosa]